MAEMTLQRRRDVIISFKNTDLTCRKFLREHNPKMVEKWHINNFMKVNLSTCITFRLNKRTIPDVYINGIAVLWIDEVKYLVGCTWIVA